MTKKITTLSIKSYIIKYLFFRKYKKLLLNLEYEEHVTSSYLILVGDT